MEKKTGLFITRAQPGLHFGQVDGIRQGIVQGIEKVIVWIGSANKEFTGENPFTYDERKKMVELSAKELFQDIEIEILPVPDMGDNEKWRNYILTNASDFQYILSGNAWVQEVFKGTDKTIIPLEVRAFIKWSTIRGQLAMHSKEALKKVLPLEVVEYLREINAPQRLSEIFSKERKTPSLVVDVVLIDQEGKLILIQRKNFPEGLALPGGFVDYGETGRQAAIRESKEELGIDIAIVEDLGTWDAADRDPRAHNVSRAFKGEILGGELKAGDDAKAVVKVDITDLDDVDFAFPDHKEMIQKALQ
jgi:8-oxo-dGTP diphosphatase